MKSEPVRRALVTTPHTVLTSADTTGTLNSLLTRPSDPPLTSHQRHLCVDRTPPSEEQRPAGRRGCGASEEAANQPRRHRCAAARPLRRRPPAQPPPRRRRPPGCRRSSRSRFVRHRGTTPMAARCRKWSRLRCLALASLRVVPDRRVG